MPPEHRSEPSPEEFGPHFDQINNEVTVFISERYNPEAAVKERFLTQVAAKPLKNINFRRKY
jgi:hypothetical protein